MVSGQRLAPAALYPLERPLVPIGQEAGWAPEPVWTQEDRGRILPHLPGIEPRSPGQARARHYSDWATPSLFVYQPLLKETGFHAAREVYSEFMHRFNTAKLLRSGPCSGTLKLLWIPLFGWTNGRNTCRDTTLLSGLLEGECHSFSV
jgi:hypothetical protein